MTDPLRTVSTRTTSQREPSDRATVENSAGGFVFATGDDVQIQRFLVLGTIGGTYYASEREITRENAALVLKVARERGRWLVDQAAAVSVAGRAPRQQPALFALAAVIGLGDDDARAYALARLPELARTGSTLFTLLNYIQQFRGWGRGLRRAVAGWYLNRDIDALAYQVLKYRQRDGWTHRDVLRQAHPKAATPEQAQLFRWLTNCPAEDYDQVPDLVHAYALANASGTSTAAVVRTIAQHPLSWEMLPDAALAEPAVWRALLEHDRVPLGALIRQLPRLTRLGVLDGQGLRMDGGPAIQRVIDRLTDPEALKRARIHPVNVLVAQRTYASGRSVKGASTWHPNSRIVDALDRAFYEAFGAVTPSGGRTLVALDVSASMTWPQSQITGMGINAREGSAAMALVTLATETHADVVGFTTSGGFARWGHGIKRLDISPRRRLDDVIRYIGGLTAGATDCALPMTWARETGEVYDTIVIYTDNETHSGSVHVHQALEQYRRQVSPRARLVVAGMTSTGFSIADPADPGQLDVVGFDSAAPQLIADFGGGRL